MTTLFVIEHMIYLTGVRCF